MFPREFLFTQIDVLKTSCNNGSNLCSEVFLSTIKSSRKIHVSLCYRADFRPLVPEFSEERFSLLWYKTLHSEVVWTKDNAGKSEFAPSLVWLITYKKYFDVKTP